MLEKQGRFLKMTRYVLDDIVGHEWWRKVAARRASTLSLLSCHLSSLSEPCQPDKSTNNSSGDLNK